MSFQLRFMKKNCLQIDLISLLLLFNNNNNNKLYYSIRIEYVIKKKVNCFFVLFFCKYNFISEVSFTSYDS